jgi:PAS domain S-box-containing protein
MPKLREYMATGIVSIFCISVSVFIFFEINSNNRNDAINNFNVNANGLVVIIEKQLSSDLVLLRSLTGFIENSPRFDRDSFQKFLQVVSPDRQSFQALEWIPRVPLDRRHAYDTFAHLDGFPDFQITERSPQGEIQAAANREEYFPVFYVEPYKGNEAALGFDLASNPARLAALEKARDSGEMVVSKKVDLVQLEKDNAGVLALTPVYRKGMPRQTIEQRRTNLIGFTLGVVKLSSVVTDHQALDRVSGLIGSSDVDFYLYDNTPQSDGELLHVHSAQESERTAPGLTLIAARSGLNLERTISIGGREWLLIARPADSRLFETITLQSWLSLLGMLVISGLVIAYLISIVRQADVVQTLVGQRTEELNAATQIAEDREERISAVVATVPDGIVTIDSLGNIETFNPAAARIFGYAAEEAIGQNVKFLMPEPYYSEHDGYLKKFAETGEKSIIGNGRDVFGRRKDGSTFPMALSVSEMNVGGKAMFTGVVRDITESQRAEKMKAEFVATVSHELRTPLTSIKGSLGLIRSGSLGELSDKLKSMLDIAYSNSDRLIRLINDILDIEKIEAGKRNSKWCRSIWDHFWSRRLKLTEGMAKRAASPLPSSPICLKPESRATVDGCCKFSPI